MSFRRGDLVEDRVTGLEGFITKRRTKVYPKNEADAFVGITEYYVSNANGWRTANQLVDKGRKS